MRKGTRICRCQHKKGTHQSKENINSSAMNGSRLGRGRAGRLAILSGATVCSLLLIYLYHSTSSEMARIRDLHVECAQQQEALATKFQVLYEYRVKLENALSNEKSANAAAKEELQQKASRERSLRDKDSLEAMQRFNSLQQNYKQLQAEQQDLKDDCKNKETAALESAKKVESTLQDLRIQLKKADEDKEKSMQHLKIKYTQLISEKEELEEKYNSLKKSVSEDNGLKARLQKQIMQLQRQLSDKISPHFSVGDFLQDSQVQPRQADVETIGDTNGVDKRAALDNNPIPLARTSSKQQTASSSTPSSVKLAVAVPAAPAPPRPKNLGPAVAAAPESSSVKPSSSTSQQQQEQREQQGIGPPSAAAATAVPPPARGVARPQHHQPRVKLPVGVPPIPRLIDPEPGGGGGGVGASVDGPGSKDRQQKHNQHHQQESVGQAPPPVGGLARNAAAPAAADRRRRPAAEPLGAGGGLDFREEQEEEGEEPQENAAADLGHADEQVLERHEAADGWYKVRPGAQEVGDPHRIEKNGFVHGGGNDDVEQYDEYNYKEPQNKNGDLHLEEGEDEREDEDDYMHNNMNAHIMGKHE